MMFWMSRMSLAAAGYFMAILRVPAMMSLTVPRIEEFGSGIGDCGDIGGPPGPGPWPCAVSGPPPPPSPGDGNGVAGEAT